MIEIVPLTGELCARMGREARAADRREFSAMTGLDATPENIERELCKIMARSHGRAMAGIYGGGLVNIWGVMTRTAISTVGHPWMVTTDLASVPRIRRAMAHRCRDAFLLSIPPHISGMWNLVDVRNAPAIRWLRWLNFQFDETPIEHGGTSWLKFRMGENVL